MTKFICIAAVAIVSYLVGSVNFSILISKAISGKDIRESGSGNAGATNMLRTHGKKFAVITLICDIAKGVLAVVLAYVTALYLWADSTTLEMIHSGSYAINTSVVNDTLCEALPYIAGLLVMLGHCFPVFFGFKGGKGVATALGVVMTLDWKIGLIVAAFAILIMAITRYVSLGSVLGCVSYILIDGTRILMKEPVNTVCFVCAVLLGALIILRHHANIKRLINGTENKLSFTDK